MSEKKSNISGTACTITLAEGRHASPTLSANEYNTYYPGKVLGVASPSDGVNGSCTIAGRAYALIGKYAPTFKFKVDTDHAYHDHKRGYVNLLNIEISCQDIVDTICAHVVSNYSSLKPGKIPLAIQGIPFEYEWKLDKVENSCTHIIVKNFYTTQKQP